MSISTHPNPAPFKEVFLLDPKNNGQIRDRVLFNSLPAPIIITLSLHANNDNKKSFRPLGPHARVVLFCSTSERSRRVWLRMSQRQESRDRIDSVNNEWFLLNSRNRTSKTQSLHRVKTNKHHVITLVLIDETSEYRHLILANGLSIERCDWWVCFQPLTW